MRCFILGYVAFCFEISDIYLYIWIFKSISNIHYFDIGFAIRYFFAGQMGKWTRPASCFWAIDLRIRCKSGRLFADDILQLENFLTLLQWLMTDNIILSEFMVAIPSNCGIVTASDQQ